MKTYTMSAASAFSHVPEHPERTAKRFHGGMDFDVTFQTWTSRTAMLKTIQMQEKRESRTTDWKACKIPAPIGAQLTQPEGESQLEQERR